MTMPASVKKDPKKRRGYLLKICGLQDDQTGFCQLDDDKCQGESCSIGKELRQKAGEPCMRGLEKCSKDCDDCPDNYTCSESSK